MSDQNVPVVQLTDLSADDQDRVAKFVERGAPGFDLTDEAKMAKMLDLYLGGKTYSQIARIQRAPKELIMLYSQRLKWYVLKMEYLTELELHLKGRVISAKSASMDFMLQLMQMYQKKIGTKMENYLRSNDESEADKINLKEIDKYLKLVEALHKTSSEPMQKSPGQQAGPAVGINIGDGITMTKSEDGSVEITPKQKTIGSMLEKLANERRADEAAKMVKTSDIKEKTPQTNGEKADEKE